MDYSFLIRRMTVLFGLYYMYGYVRYEYSTVGTVSRRMTVPTVRIILHIAALYVRGYLRYE